MVTHYHQALNRLLIALLLCWSADASAQVTWPNEPANATVLIDCNFNSMLCGYGGSSGGSGIGVDATAPLSPSSVLEYTLSANCGTCNGGGEVIFEVGNQTELYQGHYWKSSNPFYGWYTGNNKIAGFFTSFGNAILDIQGSPGGPYSYAMVLQLPGVDNCHLNNFGNGNFGDCPGGPTNILYANVASGAVTLGSWNQVEFYFKASTTATNRDGIFRLWINGTLVMDYSPTRTCGSTHCGVNLPGTFTHTWFSPTWDGTWAGSPTPQPPTSMYHRYDHLHVSTTSCGAPGCPEPTPDWPNEPTGTTTLLDFPFNVTQGSGLDDENETGTIVQSSTAILSPVNVLQSQLQAGIAPGGVSLMYQLNDLSEVFVGVWWKPNTDFQGISSGINPLFYLPITQSAGHFAWIGATNVTALSGQIGFAMTAGTGVLNNCHLLGWQGNCPGAGYLLPNQNSCTVSAADNEWHRLEVYVKRSTSASDRTGIVRWWLDGNLCGNYDPAAGTGVNYGPGGLDYWNWNEGWSATPSTQTKDWAHYLDHLYISQPQGATSVDTMPPGPVTSFTVDNQGGPPDPDPPPVGVSPGAEWFQFF